MEYKTKKINVRLNQYEIGLFIQMLEACHDLEDPDVNGEEIKLAAYLNKRMRTL